MKIPFVKAYLEGKEKLDLTPFIEWFRYEDCLDADDMMELRINPKVFEEYGYEIFKTGMPVYFSFGFAQGEFSPYASIRLTDIKVKYAERVTVSLRCLDKGTKMRKTSNNVVWKDKTTDDIVRAIAAKYGLQPVTDNPKKKWSSIPQGNKSDFQFLQDLAEMEEKGNFICFVSGNELRFVRRGLNKQSFKTYKYRDPDGEVISFDPIERESSASKGAGTTETTFVDRDKKQVVTGKAGKDTDDNSIELGGFKSVYDEYANLITTKKTSAPSSETKSTESVKCKYPGAYANDEEAKAVASSSKKKAALGLMKATLITQGQPLLKSNSIITVDGVFPQHLGNYLTRRVIHTIDAGGSYVTTSELEKNGKKKNTGTRSGAENKSIGKKKEPVVKVALFDANSNRLANVSNGVYAPPK